MPRTWGGEVLDCRTRRDVASCSFTVEREKNTGEEDCPGALERVQEKEYSLLREENAVFHSCKEMRRSEKGCFLRSNRHRSLCRRSPYDAHASLLHGLGARKKVCLIFFSQEMQRKVSVVLQKVTNSLVTTITLPLGCPLRVLGQEKQTAERETPGLVKGRQRYLWIRQERSSHIESWKKKPLKDVSCTQCTEHICSRRKNIVREEESRNKCIAQWSIHGNEHSDSMVPLLIATEKNTQKCLLFLLKLRENLHADEGLFPRCFFLAAPSARQRERNKVNEAGDIRRGKVNFSGYPHIANWWGPL